MSDEYVDMFDPYGNFWSDEYIYQKGSYNSLRSDDIDKHSRHGSMARFKNKSLDTWEKMEYTFNLTDCPFKELPDSVDYSSKEFEFKLPVSKKTIKFRRFYLNYNKGIDAYRC